MSRLINRRRLMQAGSSALMAGALGSVAGRASAAPSDELRVLVGGGDVGKAHIDAIVKPFEAETGIKVNPVTDQFSLQRLELMVSTNSVTVDVVPIGQGTLFVGSQKGLLEAIDYSIYKKEQLDGLVSYTKQPFGVASLFYSFVMVYNTDVFPANKPRPTSWAEFWDVQKFPGARSLVSGAFGGEGPWEEALLADGVAPHKIYPMDIDRIFASLDKIKPHIRKWWANGSEIQQIMRDKVATIMSSYDARVNLLIDQGAPLEINHKQSKVTWDYWAIPKGTPNVKSAQKFIEFATRADRQAARAKLVAYGPTNLDAFKQIPEEVGRRLCNHPDHLSNLIPIQYSWYVQRGSDGKSNIDRLRERWNEWILR